MRKQRTFEDLTWDALIKASKSAPHGYKENAKQRVKDFAHELLRKETTPKHSHTRKAA